jgi:hypothetical protein
VLNNALEGHEQALAREHIQRNDVVLELGGRYGMVSCAVASVLEDTSMHVVLEPDERVINALKNNIARCGSRAHVFEGVLSKNRVTLTNLDVCMGGYGSTIELDTSGSIPITTVAELESRYCIQFTALVADCEGCLQQVFIDNPQLYTQLRTVIFEADYAEKCNYSSVVQHLKQAGFQEVLGGFQNVWKKVT